MACQITVTGTAGPGLTVTALVLTGVTFYSVDPVNYLLTVVIGSVTKQFAINAATTFTTTISSGNYTIVVS